MPKKIINRDNKWYIIKFSSKIITARMPVKTGTRFVYNPEVAGPTCFTPFIKKICAKNPLIFKKSS